MCLMYNIKKKKNTTSKKKIVCCLFLSAAVARDFTRDDQQQEMQYILLKDKIHSVNSSYPITMCIFHLHFGHYFLVYLLYSPFCSPWLLFRAPSFFSETFALFKWFSCHILDFSSSPEPTLYRTVPWITIFNYRASQLEFEDLLGGSWGNCRLILN